MRVAITFGTTSFVYRDLFVDDKALVRRTAAAFHNNSDLAFKALAALHTLLCANRTKVIVIQAADSGRDGIALLTPCLKSDGLLVPESIVHTCDVDLIVRGTRGVFQPHACVALSALCVPDSSDDSSQFPVAALDQDVPHDIVLVCIGF